MPQHVDSPLRSFRYQIDRMRDVGARRHAFSDEDLKKKLRE